MMKKNLFIIVVLNFVFLIFFACEKNSTGLSSKINKELPEIVYVARKSISKDWGVAFSLNRIDANGNFHKELFSVSDGYVKGPCFTPDGEKIVFVMHSDSLGDGENLYFLDYDGNNLYQITNPDTSLTYFSPKPIPNTNKILVVVRVSYKEFQIRTVDIETKEQKILAYNAGSPFNPPLVTHDGSYIIYIEADGNIYKMNINGTEKTRLTNLSYISQPQLIQNSDKIYFVSTIDQNHFDLFSVDLSGNNLKRVTNRDDISRAYLRISPDGLKVLNLDIDKNNNIVLWVFNADGSGEKKLVTSYYTWLENLEFYPTSDRIIFIRPGDPDHGHNNHLYSISIDGSNLKLLSKEEYYDNMSPIFRPIL